MAQVSAQVCSSAPIGLVSAFGAENNALDARSRNNGTIQNGVTYTAGQVGQAFNLAGNNGDRVLLGNAANLQIQEFTIEAWVRRSSSAVVTNSGSVGVLLAYGQNGYAFYIRGNDKLSIGQVGVNEQIAPTLTITDTNWHHVAVTHKGIPFTPTGETIFYLDGVADTPLIQQNTRYSFTTSAAIGSRGDATTSDVFFGAIDELAIYNRPLAGSDIAAIFNAGTAGKCKPLATVAPEDQVLWLAGDGNANDNSGSGNNGPLGSTTLFNVGKVGQGIQFDGLVTSQIVVPDTPSLRPTTAVTVEGWVNPSSSASGFQGVLFKGNTGSAGGQPYSLFVNGSGGTRTIVVRVGNDSTFEALGSVGSIPVNVYSHVAFTYDGTTIRIYINGVLDSSVASSIGSLAQIDTNPLRIGGLGSSFAYTGGVDEIGVYNRALSAVEIQSISNAGIAGKYKVQSTVPTNIAAWYPGDGNPNDLQAANNATLLGGATYGGGKVGQAFSLNGTSSYVQAPSTAANDPTGAANGASMEAWVYFNQRPSDAGHQMYIMSKTGVAPLSGLEIRVDTDNFIKYVWRGGIISFTTVSVQVGVWYHVVATFSTATAGPTAGTNLYVNGVLLGGGNDFNPRTPSGAPLDIGHSSVLGGNRFFSGLIDEPAIYDRTLTPEEINSLFNAGNGGKYKGASNPTVATKGNAGDVSISFANLTSSGDIHQVPISLAGLPALPAGSTPTGLAYDISTTATYTGLATQCFNLPSLTTAQFSNIGVLHLESGVWIDRGTAKNTATRTLCAQTTTFSPFVIAQVLAPTAATVMVGGRTVFANGRGISGVRVTLTDAQGNIRTAVSSSFGYYRFEDVPSGETYIVSALAKRFVFADPTRVVTVDDAIEGLDFVASP